MTAVPPFITETPMQIPATPRLAFAAAGDLYVPARPSIWAKRTVHGEVIWRWLALAYEAYWVFFIAGVYTGHTYFNNVGAAFVLAALGWATLERLWVKLDAAAIACIVAAFIPLVNALTANATVTADGMVKHISLYVVMVISRLLRLPVASRSASRGIFLVQIAVVIGLSFFTDRGGVWEGGTRHSGLFNNPNNLALIPMLLLCLMDRRDPKWMTTCALAAVAAVLFITRTSGSIIAYGVGFAIYFRSFLPRRWRTLVTAGVAGIVLVSVVFLGLGGERMLPDSRFVKQIGVMRTDLHSVLEGDPISFYDQEQALGSGTASGAWRLEHWRDTLIFYSRGEASQLVFGFGIGSSAIYLGKLPHNDYIRILFEQGIVGLLLFLFAWFQIIRGAPKHIRYCGVILAIYCFSENNLDNFPFMSLFILCMSAGAGVALRAVRRPDAARVAVPAGSFA